MEKCFKFNINIQYLAMLLFALVVHDAPLCVHVHAQWGVSQGDVLFDFFPRQILSKKANLLKSTNS